MLANKKKERRSARQFSRLNGQENEEEAMFLGERSFWAVGFTLQRSK